jgi:dihydropyrimidine dehydrogenase (NAD+) subunit PreA
MTSLEVTFGGLSLRNPVVLASAPPTETVVNIQRAADVGVAAVITKTLADYDEASFPLGARRAHVDRHGMWALSTFRRETLTLAEGLRLVEAAAAKVDIPVIASIGALTMDPSAWLAACRHAVDAGASMVQLDLFYSPHPRSSAENIRALETLLTVVAENIEVPVVPKLNTELPAHLMADVLPRTPIRAALAIDSMRVPMPLDPRRGGHPLSEGIPNAPEASLFGAWQKPITLQYARTLAELTGLDLGVGGGLMNGFDAIEAIMLGASTVHFATAVIQHGFKRVSMILDQMSSYLVERGIGSVTELKGSALPSFAQREEDLQFVDARASVDHDLCTMCGHCTTLVFCPDISITTGRIEVLDHCDGCGLCVGVCPTRPKALRLVPLSRVEASRS